MNKHVPMVHRLLDPLGLVRSEAETGVSGADPKSPAPFALASHLIFNSAEEVHRALAAHGREIMGDIPNYSQVQPQVQIGEIIG